MKNELKETRKLVANLGTQLNNKSLQLIGKEKELYMTQTFLKNKEVELEKLSTDLNTYRFKYQNASFDLKKLKEYIQRLRDVQTQTSVQVGIIRPFLSPTFGPSGSSVRVTVQQTVVYTGLLLDARGLNPKPILAPSILTENREKIYGIGVTYISVKVGSLVDYIPGTIGNAKKHERIGNNPLVIMPIKVVNDSDLMISSEDVKKVAGIMPLLKQQKVAVLL